MKGVKYLIFEISALDIISSSKEKNGEYSFYFDTTELSKEYMVKETLQDDCPIFYQAMFILKGEKFNTSVICEDLRDVFVYIDFSGIFDRKPIGKVLEWQKKAEYMFKPEGITLNFGKENIRFVAFERSASMSRENRLSFVRADIYEALKERMMLGMSIGKCQLSKLYAYNALLFTSGRRIEKDDLLSDERIIVIDNSESIVPDVDIITVTDDGTDNPIRKYTRVETKADIKICEFDGEGLISKRLSDSLDSIHNSYQIRMPYIKGVVHEVDFASLFDELGVTEITDIFGNRHNPHDVDLIINKSMFKGYGWMLENNISWEEYLNRCRKYNHALYISGTDITESKNIIDLNYQFLNTLAMTTDEFRPADLGLGISTNPQWDNRAWITKTTETEYYKLVGDYSVRREHFLEVLQNDEIEETDKKKVYARIIAKNMMFVDEPIFAKELQDKAKNILNKYAVGKLLVSGDNRYLCDDLMRLLGYIVRSSEGESEAYKALEKEFLTDNFMYAPKATYEESEFYTLLRSPHIARNEEAVARPLEDIGKFREKYLSHLHYVVMVDSRSLIPERLGGADFDGDMVKTVADKLLNACVMKSSTALPVLKIPTAEPLISDSNDWYARFLTVKNTFSSRVGQISNAALSRGIIAYDESLTKEEREHYLQEVETLAILTGLEIDSAKSGIKPDLSEYIEHSKVTKSLFLKYKAIIDSDRFSKWYDESKYMKLKKYFEKLDWSKVTSNLEKLPYYAFNLEKHTEKALVKPVPDANLFEFANEPEWKEKLNPDTLKKVETIIADYEEALKRVRQIRHTSSEMKRKADIYRILFARGQETEYSVDELYAAFDNVSPSDIRNARNYLFENMWQFTPHEEREQVIYSLFTSAKIYRYTDLFCDFSKGGYRVLGDIICDIDDMHRAIGLKKNLLHQKGDSEQMKTMIAGVGRAGDYKAQIKRNCMNIIRPFDRKKSALDYAEVVKCAVALSKRQFALEVLPNTILELSLDRSHIYKLEEEEPEKKRWFRR
ncbi:MAG: hypothetical protein IKI97_10025 [Clostridia bacterium]|nr:hypothetical protein [Clostridia bacterium]